jgi:hypothetical protein
MSSVSLPKLVSPADITAVDVTKPLVKLEHQTTVSNQHGPIKLAGEQWERTSTQPLIRQAHGAGMSDWARVYELPGPALKDAMAGAEQLVAALPGAGANLPRYETRGGTYTLPDLDKLLAGLPVPEPENLGGVLAVADRPNPFVQPGVRPLVTVVRDGERHLGVVSEVRDQTISTRGRFNIRPNVTDATTATPLQDAVKAVVGFGQHLETPELNVSATASVARTVPGIPIGAVAAGVGAATATAAGLLGWVLTRTGD